jgi:hypothetical protein
VAFLPRWCKVPLYLVEQPPAALGRDAETTRRSPEGFVLRHALEAFIDLCHLLVEWAGEIDRGFLDRSVANLC